MTMPTNQPTDKRDELLLREALAKTINLCGGFARPDASVEFLCIAPAEVEAKIAALTSPPEQPEGQGDAVERVAASFERLKAVCLSYLPDDAQVGESYIRYGDLRTLYLALNGELPLPTTATPRDDAPTAEQMIAVNKVLQRQRDDAQPSDVGDIVERLEDEAAALQRAAWARPDGGQDACIAANLATEAAATIRQLSADDAALQAKVDEGLVEAQQAKRKALVERLLTTADLCCANPLPGELGDVAYDLLRQAAAQIASDRLHFERASQPSDVGDIVDTVHVVFDGPPGPVAGRFVECEAPDGRSINAGEWHERDSGYWELRIPSPATIRQLSADNAAKDAAIERYKTSDTSANHPRVSTLLDNKLFQAAILAHNYLRYAQPLLANNEPGEPSPEDIMEDLAEAIDEMKATLSNLKAGADK